jgi:putative transposase
MAKKIYTVRFRQDFIDAWTRSIATFQDHCDRFGVSRQSGYDWLEKVRLGGFEGLATQSSAPHHCPHATSDEIAELVIAARKMHPTWGPRKLGPWILTRHPAAEPPAPSTRGEILKRAGLVPPRKKRQRTPRYADPFQAVEAPNDV